MVQAFSGLKRSLPLDYATSVNSALELDRRIRFLDFNGGEAMKASEKVGLENALPEDFVKKEVTTMYDAIQKLCAFFKRNS